jgi:hypothetical protein
MTDEVSKLPAWPPSGVTIDAMAFFMAERDAYRARMEALEIYTAHVPHCAIRPDAEGCTCGLDALLAACEREEGR